MQLLHLHLSCSHFNTHTHTHTPHTHTPHTHLHGQHISEAEKVNYEQALQDALLIFPKLQTGIDVNVSFSR